MLAKGDDDGLVLKRQAGGFWLFRAGRKIGHRTALLPFCNGLWIDPIALGQRPQALLTILYCSTDCLCRCDAAVTNLSPSASFHSRENNAPSNPGIKHLAPGQCPEEVGALRLLTIVALARASLRRAYP